MVLPASRGGFFLAVGLVLMGAGRAAWPQGQAYRLTREGVEVATAAQWEAWECPAGIARIAPDGVVTPVYIDTTENAVADAAAYAYTISEALRGQYDTAFLEGTTVKARGGIKKVGSGTSSAVRAIDGDDRTCWEPGAGDPVDTWWIEVDLGRVVSATRVIIRFAEDLPDDRSDPFLQFRVHSSAGQSPFGPSDQSGALDYELVGGTTQPNKSRRVFSFDLTPVGPYSPGWTGRLVQYLRVTATDSDLGRAGLITAEEWRSLGAADRGEVDYVWRIGGEERIVTPQFYGELPQDQQGGVRHYRRERPRLAEVEVWTVGRNVALGILERGGTVDDPNATAFPERIFDGRIATYWDAIVYSTVGDIAGWGHLTIDLGALFRLRAVRPVTGTLGRVLYGYELRGSDGALAPDGSLIWQALSGEERLLNQDTRLFEDRFEPRRIRYLEFRNLDVARRTRAHEGHRYPSTVSEIQIYAVGYVPELVLNSGFIDLQQPRSLTTIHWDAETPPGTSVRLRTRTGDELRQLTRYYNAQGQELLSKEAYDRLPSFAKGQTLVEVLPGAGWSGWSQTYATPGEPVRSPSPRRYLMVEARLESNDAERAARLRRVYVNFSDPVAESVVAEIQPKRGVPLGEPVDLQVYLRPRYARTNPRVDHIRLVAPSGVAMSLREIAVGRPAELASGAAQVFARQSDGRFADSAGRVAVIGGDGTDTLVAMLPQVLADEELARLTIATSVYQSGATFQASVANQAWPAVWQSVDGGDAAGDELAPGEGMTVLAPLDPSNLRSLGASALVVTPNGDGVTDQVVVEFAVLRINASREVTVSVFDLSGRRLRRLNETRPQATGRYAIPWDGTDERGEIVPPGIYLARIEVDTDGTEGDVLTRAVYVAY